MINHDRYDYYYGSSSYSSSYCYCIIWVLGVIRLVLGSGDGSNRWHGNGHEIWLPNWDLPNCPAIIATVVMGSTTRNSKANIQNYGHFQSSFCSNSPWRTSLCPVHPRRAPRCTRPKQTAARRYSGWQPQWGPEGCWCWAPIHWCPLHSRYLVRWGCHFFSSHVGHLMKLVTR